MQGERNPGRWNSQLGLPDTKQIKPNDAHKLVDLLMQALKFDGAVLSMWSNLQEVCAASSEHEETNLMSGFHVLKTCRITEKGFGDRLVPYALRAALTPIPYDSSGRKGLANHISDGPERTEKQMNWLHDRGFVMPELIAQTNQDNTSLHWGQCKKGQELFGAVLGCHFRGGCARNLP